MPWITDDALRSAVASAVYGGAAADLPSNWNAIIPWANRSAYYAVRAALLNRGFAADVIDDWEQNAEFNERLGVCMAVKRAAMRGEGVNAQAAIDDCKEALEELKTVAVVVDGEVAAPATGRIGSGSIDDTGDRWQAGEPGGGGGYEDLGTRL